MMHSYQKNEGEKANRFEKKKIWVDYDMKIREKLDAQAGASGKFCKNCKGYFKDKDLVSSGAEYYCRDCYARKEKASGGLKFYDPY